MTDIARNPLRVDFARTDEDGRVPTQAKHSDAGYDLRAVEPRLIYPGTRRVISTGIAVAIPRGYVGYIKPRSGLAAKHGIDVLAGVIDSGYRGEIKVVLLNTDQNNSFQVGVWDRIAQLVIQPVMDVEFTERDVLPESERAGAGFGSTGINNEGKS